MTVSIIFVFVYAIICDSWHRCRFICFVSTEMPVHSLQADSRFVGCQPRSFVLCHFFTRRSGRCRGRSYNCRPRVWVALVEPRKGRRSEGLYGWARGAAAWVNLIAVIVSSFSWLRYTSDFTVGRSADWLCSTDPWRDVVSTAGPRRLSSLGFVVIGLYHTESASNLCLSSFLYTSLAIVIDGYKVPLYLHMYV